MAWNANSESNLSGYVVQYGTRAGSPSSSVDVGRVTSRRFTSLTAGTRYYFRVVAYNTAGQQSAPSSEVSYLVPGTPAPPPPPPPSGGTPNIDSVSPSSGPIGGGTQITIAGSSFASGATVRIGGRSGTTTYVSSTQLRVITPAGAATGGAAVQVTNPNGQSATRGNAFTYTGSSSSGATPSFNGIAPTSGPISGGTQVTISGSNFVSGATVRIGGRAATSVTFVSSTQLRARTPAGAAGGSTSVQVVNPNGRSASRGNAFYYTGSSNATAAQTMTSAAGAEATTLSADAGDAMRTAAIDEAVEASAPALEESVGLDLAPRTRGAASYRRFLASTPLAEGGHTRLALANAEAADAAVVLTFTDASGQATRLPFAIPARQRRTVDPSTLPQLQGASSWSVALESDRQVALERLITWGRDGSAASLTAASDAATRWYFPDGSTSQPFDLSYAVHNPGSEAADLEVRYLRPGGEAPIVRRHAVEPGQVAPIRVALEDAALADTDVAVEIVSLNDAPVVVERSVSLALDGDAERRGGETVSGVASPASSWWLTGATGSQTLFLVIANPGEQPAVAEVTYTVAGGRRIVRRHDVAAQGRTTVDVAREDASLANAAVGIRVDGVDGAALVVERSAWWGANGAWTDGLSGGASSEPAARWLLAEGEEGGDRRAATSLSILNTAARAAAVRVTLLFEDARAVSQTVTAPAGAPLTLPIARLFPNATGRRFSVLVESVSGDASLVVDRSLFWSAADGATAGAATPAVALATR